MSDPRATPAMRQYAQFKAQHPGCVLFFRMGDFYEMFDEDAEIVSRDLGLTLTQRTKGVPMAGVPYHQLDMYLRRAIDAGHRVAVCEQIEDPKAAQQAGRSVVNRAVTRVLTPGTLVDETLIGDESAQRLAAVVFLEQGDDARAGVAICELSTGEFIITDCAPDALIDELAGRAVREVLFAETADGKPPPRVQRVLDGLNASPTPRPTWQFRRDEAGAVLCEHYGVSTLAGFGLNDDDPALPAAGVLIAYLRETQPEADTLATLSPPRREPHESGCIVDAVSLRSLEVERTIRTGRVEGSLVGVFLEGQGKGLCRTPMGKRLIRDWLCRPLFDARDIRARQRCIGTLIEDSQTARELRETLDDVQDVARIGGRLALGRATPRDLAALGRSLCALPALLETIEPAPSFVDQAEQLQRVREALAPLAERIAAECVDEPPVHLREGGLIRDGVDAELDEARLLQRDAGHWLAEYQQQLNAEHDLPGLKVGFNKVFGYYIELPAAQARRAPQVFTRKQTLKNAERYITPELKEFEDKVTTAEARAVEREQAMFKALCDTAAASLDQIRAFADTVAQLDALSALADKAARRGWVRPDIVEEPVLDIRAGRHPVLDEVLADRFVPNDITLGTAEQPDNPAANADDAGPPAQSDVSGHGPRLALITGPNMAGKSTFIRQTALLVLLAHAGSYIPAQSARIGLCDRVFTRVGADDALHEGQSTFMVEMIETANILNHASVRSLVVLDEIGRGTSTLDGLSLAWAIAESLAGDQDMAGPRTLFATHYHELTDLAEQHPARVRNLHVEVREWPAGGAPPAGGHAEGPSDGHAEIVFLHRIRPGRADQSYGIHVARLAGVPGSVVHRAREVLASLSVQHAPPQAPPDTPAQSPIQSPVQSPAQSPAQPPPGAEPSAARKGGRAARPRAEEPAYPLFQHESTRPTPEVVLALQALQLESLSPLAAFDELRRLKAIADNHDQR